MAGHIAGHVTLTSPIGPITAKNAGGAFSANQITGILGPIVLATTIFDFTSTSGYGSQLALCLLISSVSTFCSVFTRNSRQKWPFHSLCLLSPGFLVSSMKILSRPLTQCSL